MERPRKNVLNQIDTAKLIAWIDSQSKRILQEKLTVSQVMTEFLVAYPQVQLTEHNVRGAMKALGLIKKRVPKPRPTSAVADTNGRHGHAEARAGTMDPAVAAIYRQMKPILGVLKPDEIDGEFAAFMREVQQPFLAL